jgi:hypothetical protein
MFRRALIESLTGKRYILAGNEQGGYTKRLSGYYAEAAIENVFKQWA